MAFVPALALSPSTQIAPVVASSSRTQPAARGTSAGVPSHAESFPEYSGFRRVAGVRQFEASTSRSFEASRAFEVVCDAGKKKPKKDASAAREKILAVPPSPEEETVYELKPHFSEIVGASFATLSIIGAPLLIGAISRQLWVRYKITNRRVTVVSGFQGKDRFDVSYPNIENIRYVQKALGSCADMVVCVRGGGKIELRAVPNWKEVFDYIMTKVPEEVRQESGVFGSKNFST
eukprot:tig00020941_g16238.t1